MKRLDMRLRELRERLGNGVQVLAFPFEPKKRRFKAVVGLRIIGFGKTKLGAAQYACDRIEAICRSQPKPDPAPAGPAGKE